jgi:hypothetical protein
VVFLSDNGSYEKIIHLQPLLASRLATVLDNWTKNLPTRPDQTCCSQARCGPQSGLIQPAHD